MKKYYATILVAEDDPNDQDLIRIAFESCAVTGTVHFVSDGLQAIAYMMGEGKYSDRDKYPYPTFIITDLRMPQADGFTVLQHLKANPAFAIIPTVVLSASSDPDDIKIAYLLGASSYHVKPPSFDELRHQLKVLHDYWMTCHVPEVDISGKQLLTESKDKLGERISRLPPPNHQTRVNE